MTAVETRIEDIRRANVRKLFTLRSASDVSRKLGYKTTSFMSQIAGPAPTREVTDKTARAMEVAYGYPRGAMDKEDWSPMLADAAQPAAGAHESPTQSSPQSDSPNRSATMSPADTVKEAILLVSRLTAQHGVTLPAEKVADITAMGFADALEHGGVPREAYILALVKLLSK